MIFNLKRRIAIVVLLSILMIPLILSNVTTNPASSPPETCLALRGFGKISGQVLYKNYLGDYRTLGWAEVTATSLDGEFIAVNQTDGQGMYSLFVPAGEAYNITIYAPYPSDPGRYWYGSAIVSVWTGIATYNFYLDEPIPEFSDYAISFVMTVALLTSVLMIRRMKGQNTGLKHIKNFNF